MNMMNILDHTGHSKMLWDPAIPSQVQMARDMFATMRGKGHSIFRIGADGEEGARMTEFDPTATKMIVVPQLVGG